MTTSKQSANLQVTILNTPREDAQFHQDAELLYILEGAMDLRAGEQEAHLPPESIYVVNGGRQYSYTASGYILFVRLTLPTQLVRQNNGVASAVFWCDPTRGGQRLLRRPSSGAQTSPDRRLGVLDRDTDLGYLALCYQLLDPLSTSSLLHDTGRETVSESAPFEGRMAQIESYLHANFNRAASSKELADKLYLSQGYLSRFFKKHYGMSFAECLTKIRLATWRRTCSTHPLPSRTLLSRMGSRTCRRSTRRSGSTMGKRRPLCVRS